ncbi:hypothetical protein [Catenulispora subtropica]|uniref:PPE protein n=1 Tax=Catenulispora subtropica TaxID=450798 RepID=A0ABN2SF27_9ACTN
MTEPQFDYSGLTLDELRSLASSPQVGAMEAMPHAFRNLADRVGEVAELLSRAQADLPNWWKGTAAEQAASTLGRAAAEAREFHESALGAATAVSRCAAVVAEQQHQMMNVPEVAEPGVTDTVVRPRTPMEALEAARQSTAYHAAHEQAVQVVHGIAAQYVETRQQLMNIGNARGESFSITSDPNQPVRTHEEIDDIDALLTEREPIPLRPPGGSASTSTILPSSPHEDSRTNYRARPATGKPASARAGLPELGASTKTRYSGDRYEPFQPDHNQALINMRDIIALSPEDGTPEHGSQRATSTNLKSTSAAAQLEIAPGKSTMHPYIMFHIDGSHGDRPELKNAQNNQSTDKESASSSKRGDLDVGSHGRYVESGQTPHSSGALTTHLDYSPLARHGDEAASRRLPYISNAPQAHLHSDIQSPLNAGQDFNNAGFIPPPGSAAAVRRERENRNPRPGYLKERKSTWIPDIIAAPANGVITAEWLAQQSSD